MHAPWAIILPAAGQSTRFGGDRNKLHAMLADQSILQHSLNAFLQRQDICWIGVALNERDHATRLLLQALNDVRLEICPGGTCRADSVRQALTRVPDSIEWVGVHDAARPLVSQSLIDRVLSAAREHGAAAPAVPIHSTIKQADGPLPAQVRSTVPRNRLWAMQTPQIMRRVDLLHAYQRCPIPLDQITDDIQLLELAGQESWLVEGEEYNIKITTALDLKLARSLKEDFCV